MEYLNRLTPNIDGATAGERFVIETESHKIIVEARPNGPYTKGFYLGFAGAEPPLTQSDVETSEVWIKDDAITVGEKFEFNYMYPLLTKNAFIALGIKRASDAETTASEQ